ncbi:MAG: hypothetical protein ACK5T0_05370 [Vampirovibrionales bacterium]|jgi:hypothetical protein
MHSTYSSQKVLNFFANSDFLDRVVLRPIDHLGYDWELTWDSDKQEYKPEQNSLAEHLNILIRDIASATPEKYYHTLENKWIELFSDVKQGAYKLNSNRLWVDSLTDEPVPKDMLGHMLEQATCCYEDIPDLITAVAGRVQTSMGRGKKTHFDQLDNGHMQMIGIIMTVILFRRSDYPPTVKQLI